MSLYKSHASSSETTITTGTTEFDILKSSHKFLREADEGPSKTTAELSWDEQLAKKYYDNLYREFAVCDLKHYKSGNFALRWRTEGEVLSGAGEETCGNTRCPHHRAHGSSSATNRLRQGWPTDADAERESVSLVTLELPFSYVEGGESKFALVKVVLCDKCRGKLMWKRRKEKEEREREGVVLGVQAGNERDGEGVAAGEDVSGDVRGKVHEGSEERARRHARKRHREHDRDAEEGREITRRRHSRRSSRSRSPEGRLIVPPHSRNHS